MVAAVETARRHRLAEPLLKELVGGDRVTARFLYGQPFTFKPCCKVLLAANDPPTITDTDSGIWRRLRRLPFEHVVERPDAAIKARLTSPAGGRAVLRWAIQGCLDWQRDGLGSCSRVAGATAALRVEMNPVAEYFAAATVTGPELSVPAATLRASYEAWCLANGTRPVSGRDWASRLRGMGFERRQGPRPDRAWHWFGVGLVADRIET
jgi:putative DNA primase/helicase